MGSNTRQREIITPSSPPSLNCLGIDSQAYVRDLISCLFDSSLFGTCWSWCRSAKMCECHVGINWIARSSVTSLMKTCFLWLHHTAYINWAMFRIFRQVRVCFLWSVIVLVCAGVTTVVLVIFWLQRVSLSQPQECVWAGSRHHVSNAKCVHN